MEEREISISPMFKWLTKRFDKKGKKAEKVKKVEKAEKVEKAKKVKKAKKMRGTKLLWGREFKTVKKGLAEEQVVDFVNEMVAQYGASLDPLLETTATNAEQLAASIKMKAQQEAEAEAERIISQAKQDVQEIKLSAEIAAEAKLATEKKAEDILSTVKRKTEIIETEAKQRTLLYLLKAREEIEKQIREDYKKAYSRLSSSLQDLMSVGQNIEVELKDKRTTLWESKSFELKEYETALLDTSEEVVPFPETLAPTETEIESDIASKEEVTEEPAQLQEEATEERTEQLVQLQEETTVSEPTEEVAEGSLGQHPPEEIPDREDTNATQLKPGDSQTLYTGEVELAIAIPVELKMVSKLYNYLQTIPDVKTLRTTGSWDRGTTITVVADKPTPLISIISEIPGVEVISEVPQQDSSAKRASSSRLRAGEQEAKRIKLTLKEVPSP